MRILIFLIALTMCALPPSFASSRPLCASWKISQAFADQEDVKIISDYSLNLPHAVEVYPYALQPWNTAKQAGQGLLKYDPSKGWVLLSKRPSMWKVSSLVEMGVPQNTAKQLMEQLQHTCN